MIPNQVEAEIVSRGSVAPAASLEGLGNAQARRLRLILAGAVIAVCIPVAVFARSQNSSAAGMQAERQQELVQAAKAEKDVDVGTFYMHKGDYGAAISRLEEAVQLDPRYPKARLLLAESYEKQGDRSRAVETYEGYLKAFPDARDEKKIRKKIEELSRRRD